MMKIRALRPSPLRILLAALLAAVLVLVPASTKAQATGTGTAIRDEPTAFSPPPLPKKKESHGVKRFFESVCWYLPNRVADLFDIPRLYLTGGDGQGVSVRATKLLEATWFQDDAYILGWSPRHSPFSGEQIEERYLGFLAAQQGEKDRDPTELGLSLHFIAVGGNIAVSLSQALDFVAGVVGVDLMNDDHGPTMFNYVKEEPAPMKKQEMTRTEESSTSSTTTTVVPAAPMQPMNP